MGINDVFKNLLGVEIIEDDEDDIYEDDEEITEDEKKRSSKNKMAESKKLPIITGDGSTVILCEPSEFNDSPEVCDNLKKGITVVVNMENAETSEAKKIFDFLSGAVYVLEGSMRKIADNIFILAPKGIDIRTSDSEEYDVWEYQD